MVNASTVNSAVRLQSRSRPGEEQSRLPWGLALPRPRPRALLPSVLPSTRKPRPRVRESFGATVLTCQEAKSELNLALSYPSPLPRRRCAGFLPFCAVSVCSFAF